MKSGSWKKAENRFARDVGTMRKPCDGSRDGKDFEKGMFGYQLKYRKTFPSWLWTWLRGIVSKCAESDQIGVLVLNRPNHDRSEALVIVRWSDWVALHGAIVTPPEPNAQLKALARRAEAETAATEQSGRDRRER